MSRWTDSPSDAPRDDGFSLLEVVVALGILMVVVTALLPQLIGGIRATAVSNRSTVLKTVAQGEIEALRNLPYRVSYDADPDVIDLLDHYYPDLVGPGSGPADTCSSGTYVLPTSSWTGYVGATGDRCDFEPASGGPFYRTVTLQTHDVLGEIALVTAIQFLSAGDRASPAAETLPPRDTYDSRVPAHDVPPSSQVSAAVTVLYRIGDEVRSHTAYTQIAQRLLSPTRLRSEADVTTVEISSTRKDGAALSLRAGGINLEGALSHASTATANVAAALGSVATGDPATSESVYGAARTVAAPPASLIGVLDVETPGECGLLCWGDTSLAPSTTLVTTDSVRPRVGSFAQPAQAMITDLANDGLRFDNAVDHWEYRPDWEFDGPVVRLAPSATPAPTGVASCVPGAGDSAFLSATGYLNALAADDTSSLPDVEACAVARSSTLSVLPTIFAPEGVVRVTLRSAYARCVVDNGVADEASSDGGADILVEVYTAEEGDEYDYVDYTQLMATDLDDIPVDGSGEETRFLGDYLDRLATVSEASVETEGNQVSVEIPAAVTIVTKPVRGEVVLPTLGSSLTEESTSDTADPSATAGSTDSTTENSDLTASDPTASLTAEESLTEPEPEPEVVLDPTSFVTLAIGSVSCSALDAR